MGKQTKELDDRQVVDCFARGIESLFEWEGTEFQDGTVKPGMPSYFDVTIQIHEHTEFSGVVCISVDHKSASISLRQKKELVDKPMYSQHVTTPAGTVTPIGKNLRGIEVRDLKELA